MILGLALAVIVLGIIGIKKEDPSYSYEDAFYESLKLFGLGASTKPPTPVSLQIARVLGPIVIGYAAIRGLVVLSREHLRLLVFRRFLRGHVVIAGIGTGGFRAAKAFYDRGFQVVAIEREPTNPAIAGCRERGIAVLIGDAADRKVLRKVGVNRARHLIVMCGHEVSNVDVAIAARDVAAERRVGKLNAHVELDNLDLWRKMTAEAVSRPGGSGFRIEFFNLFALGARLLLDEHPPFDGEHPIGDWHVVVLGMQGAGPHLLLGILKLWRNRPNHEGDALHVIVAGEVTAELRKFLEGYPEAREIPSCELNAVELERPYAGFCETAPATEADATYVAQGSDAESLDAALMLRDGLPAAAFPVVVALDDDDSGAAAVLREGDPTRPTVPFGVLSTSMSPDALLDGPIELLARASHESHRRAHLSHGETAATNSSLVEWIKLGEPLQESNRHFADGIAKHLKDLGYVAVPAPLIDPEGPLFEFNKDEVDLLAPLEHARWDQDLRRDGWRPGPRDPEHKLHPKIGVSWGGLEESYRENDRNHIRAIPEILALAGFEIVRARPDLDHVSKARPAARIPMRAQS